MLGLLEHGDAFDWISIGEQISCRLNAPTGLDYVEWLQENIGALELKDASLALALKSLEIPIMTTNYDTIIEKATGLQTITLDEITKIGDVLARKSQGVIHLHGVIDRPASIVIGIRDYDNLISDSIRQTILRYVSIDHSLIFIGCGSGVDDLNIRALLSWIRKSVGPARKKSYIIVRNCETSAFDASDDLLAVPYGDDYKLLTPFVNSILRHTRETQFGQASSLSFTMNGYVMNIQYSSKNPQIRRFTAPSDYDQLASPRSG